MSKFLSLLFIDTIFSHILEQILLKSDVSSFTFEKFDLFNSISINKYIASSLVGSRSKVVFIFFSSSPSLSYFLNIFAKYKYDFASLGLNTIFL